MEPQTKMSSEERRRLDRQRFIGLETQKKLLASRIFITPLNGPNTQLAKNLILAGVNVTIYDDSIVTEDDFQTNFLVAADQIGKKRGQVIFQKLKEMNPSGKNQLFLEEVPLDNLQFFNRFTIICTSFTNFDEMKKWDKVTKQINKPYYNLVTVGLYGFVYISLGKVYRYRELGSKNKKQTTQVSIECLSLEECLDSTEILKLKSKECDFLIGVLMMANSQSKSLSYNPFMEFSLNSEMLKCMIELGVDYKEECDQIFLRNFARLYGIDYCPTYSVIGSIISQEIIKVVQNQHQPALNWLIFNSEEGFAQTTKLKKQKEKIKKQLKSVE